MKFSGSCHSDDTKLNQDRIPCNWKEWMRTEIARWNMMNSLFRYKINSSQNAFSLYGIISNRLAFLFLLCARLECMRIFPFIFETQRIPGENENSNINHSRRE